MKNDLIAIGILALFVLLLVLMVCDVDALLARLAGECTCDPRFSAYAHDVDCPTHGLAQLGAGRTSQGLNPPRRGSTVGADNLGDAA